LIETSDLVVKAIDEEKGVLAHAAVTTNLAEEARKIHGCLPTAAAALGRMLTAASMMGAMLKEENQSVTIQVNGKGPAGPIVVVADSKARVRGYIADPQAELPLNAKGKLDVGGIVGRNGNLTVVKDLGLKEPYIGQVPLVSGEIAEDLTLYFARSEQVPSAVALGVLIETDGSVKAAGGFIIQLLPDAGDEVIDLVEKNLAEVKSVTELIKNGETPEELLKLLLKDFKLKFTSKMPTSYFCGCNRERLERVIISLGRQEVEDILREKNELELTCNFCNKKYTFSKEEVTELMKRAEER